MTHLSHTIRLGLVVAAVSAALALPVQAQALDAPTVVVTDNQATAISVVWYGNVWGVATERAMAAGSSYAVTLTDKSTDDVVESFETGENTMTFEELTPNHAYTLGVVMTLAGETSAETATTVRTAPDEAESLAAGTVAREIHRDVIDNTPINQFGDAASSKWLAKLSWKKPNGKIRYYRVNVYAMDGDLVATKKTKKRTAGISGLKLKRTYEYEVVAYFNDSYQSAASERKSFRLKKKY